MESWNQVAITQFSILAALDNNKANIWKISLTKVKATGKPDYLIVNNQLKYAIIYKKIAMRADDDER